jgi:ABC-type multidrug transport system fused ATPase/permease subunit
MDDNRLRVLRNQVLRLQRRLEQLRRTSYRYSWMRLIAFIAGALASAIVFFFFGPWFGLITAILALLVFAIAVYYHRLIEDSITRHRVWLGIKSAHIARMCLDWEHIPSVLGYRPRYDHPFEADLDLVGDRSLHRLIDTSVSYEGSRRLRAWLTAPVPQLEQISQRQQLVRELTPLSLFRDKLVLNTTIAPSTRRTWDAEELSRWLKQHSGEVSHRGWLFVAAGLAAFNIALFIANALGWLPPIWQVTFLLYLGLVLYKARETGEVFEEAMALQDALRQLGAAFRQLETYSYRNTPHLESLCSPFLDETHRPSRFLRRLNRIVAAMGLRGNPFVWFVLNAVVPWDLFFAQRLMQCKKALAERVPTWTDVWFELEALNSLANFAYLNPVYTLPDVMAKDANTPPFVFNANELGHPLIPHADKICNDFTIAEMGEVTIITGSNMAGKSVFLKTVGINLALAYAGGPVNAQRLETVLFRLFTSIQVTDSVIDGISYFYAEVKRLKALLEELEREHALPLFWLVDEIFRGTNNRERLLGSRALIRALVEKRGVGLIATHDLDLTRLADEIPCIRNYHFRDAVVEDRMAFDYTLHSGPCPTTNALKIMHMEGLPVPTDLT